MIMVIDIVFERSLQMRVGIGDACVESLNVHQFFIIVVLGCNKHVFLVLKFFLTTLFKLTSGFHPLAPCSYQQAGFSSPQGS